MAQHVWCGPIQLGALHVSDRCVEMAHAIVAHGSLARAGWQGKHGGLRSTRNGTKSTRKTDVRVHAEAAKTGAWGEAKRRRGRDRKTRRQDAKEMQREHGGGRACVRGKRKEG